MNQLTTTELAQRLTVSKGRVSQWVSEGKLTGCYQGDGRSRRFDLEKCAAALGRVLDKGQMLGNGAETRRAIRQVKADAGQSTPSAATQPDQRRDGLLDRGDPDRLELAKIATAEENLRRIRRDNELAEGHYILAEEAERQMARLLSQEVAEVETVLRDAARKVADKLGVEFKAVRALLTETWRAHREGRSTALQSEADDAGLTEAEKSADI